MEGGNLSETRHRHRGSLIACLFMHDVVVRSAKIKIIALCRVAHMIDADAAAAYSKDSCDTDESSKVLHDSLLKLRAEPLTMYAETR